MGSFPASGFVAFRPAASAVTPPWPLRGLPRLPTPLHQKKSFFFSYFFYLIDF